jgi:hypothetical protein
MNIPDGLTVRFTHKRRLRAVWANHTFLGTYWDARREGLEPEDILPHGGLTTCRLVDEYGETVAEGTAVCSKRDNYSKRLGRAISMGRAIEALRMSDSASRGHV